MKSLLFFASPIQIVIFLTSIFLTVSITHACSSSGAVSRQAKSQHEYEQSDQPPQEYKKKGQGQQQSEEQSPEIGAYRKNFKGVIMDIISEIPNSDISLPYLNVEENFYFGRTIQLNCNASYPVKWVYSGDGAPAVHTETFRSAPDIKDPTTYGFQASVIFTHTAERQSGMYTCQGIQKPELQSSFYIYVPGNKTTFLLDNSEPTIIHINPYSNQDDGWTTLPCTVSNETAKVQLYKFVSNETLEHLEPSKNLVYEPHRGFRVKPKKPEDIFGNYVCSTENEHRPEKLNIKVEPLQQEDKDNEVPKGVYPLEMIYDGENHRIVCCNKKKEVKPQLKSTGCNSISDCEIRTKYLRGKSCPEACEHGVVRVNKSCTAYELSETREEGIIECYYEDYAAFRQFSKEHDVIITEFDKLPPLEDILSIMKEDLPPSKSKEGLHLYACHANSFFFSTGLKMAWENPDGSMDWIEEAHFPLSNTFEIIPDANHRKTRLYCFAPLWDSPYEWKNVSLMTS